jgi:hypothetical protein
MHGKKQADKTQKNIEKLCIQTLKSLFTVFCENTGRQIEKHDKKDSRAKKPAPEQYRGHEAVKLAPRPGRDLPGRFLS